jgi:hypothetical protein
MLSLAALLRPGGGSAIVGAAGQRGDATLFPLLAMHPITVHERPNAMQVRPALVVCLAIATTFGASFASTAGGDEKPAKEPAWTSLFDGRALGQWKKTSFGGEGEVDVKDGRLVIAAGNPMSGVTWSGKYPKIDYEIALEAMRVDGSDFFCGLTFPVGDESCSFICGGWGGGVVGLSSLDGADASENETTSYKEFKNGRWYKLRVRVTKDKIEAWIDDERVANVDTKDKRISIRIEVEPSRPVGIATYNTTAAVREIKVREIAR